MLTIKTSRFDGEYGEKTVIYPAIEVKRNPMFGITMRDPACENRRTYYKQSRIEQFPSIKSRRLFNIRLCDSHIIYDDANIYTDNLITAKFAHNEQMFRDVANLHADIAISKEKETEVFTSISEPVILSSNEGSGTWGHWLIHNFPKIALASEVYPNHKILVPSAYFGGRYENFGKVMEAFGIPKERMIRINQDEIYAIEDATIVDFLYTESIHSYCIEIFDKISMHCQSGINFGSRVLIDRITPGKREITNRNSVLEKMSAVGFRSIDLGSFPFKDQVKTWNTGNMFCSVLGSDLSNIVFGKAGSSIMALTPSNFGDNFFFDLSTAKGMIWNELFCGNVSVDRGPMSSDFVVDEQTFDRFISACCRNH